MRHLLPGSRPRALGTAVLLLGALLSSGCLSLKPYREIRREVPAERFVTVGDQAVYVEQQGSGPPLVLLHGYGESAYTWRKVVPALSTRYRTIAIDLNGFGWTERPEDAVAYSRDGQLKMVAGVLDTLGVESAVFAGHSYGGALSLWMAALHPERVSALVLIDSAAPTYPDAKKSRVARIRPLARLALPLALSVSSIQRSLRRAFYDDRLATEELAAAYRERLAIEGVLDAYMHLSAPPPSPGPSIDLASVRQPVLLIWGREDRSVPAAEAQETAARLPRARFVDIPECGHVPIEECPEEMLEVLLPFLADPETLP